MTIGEHLWQESRRVQSVWGILSFLLAAEIPLVFLASWRSEFMPMLEVVLIALMGTFAALGVAILMSGFGPRISCPACSKRLLVAVWRAKKPLSRCPRCRVSFDQPDEPETAAVARPVENSEK